jgi:hypothetical protein
MGILEQARFGHFEHRGHDQEERPGAHLWFRKATNKDHGINEAEKSQGKALEDRIKTGPDPVG